MKILLWLAGLVCAVGVWLFYQHISGDETSSGHFPARTANGFYNDSDIGGADEYAVFELKRATETTGFDFCLVLREELPKGYSIESYASELFEKWRVGGEHDEKGVLFVIIEDIQEIKIEVSYELEQLYPDAFCASFQNAVKMYMSGEYHGDVFSTMIMSMVKKAKGQKVELPVSKIRRGGMSQFYLSGGAGATTRDFYANIKKRVAETKQYDETDIVQKYYAGETAAESAQNFLSALRSGVDYPFLPVLTKGSQMMRLEYPHPPSQLKQFWKRYKKALPMYVMEEGDFAVARFAGEAAIPLLLRKSPEGLWYVDFVKTWAFSASTPDETQCWLLNKESPWMFGFRDVSWKLSNFKRPSLRPLKEDPYETIASMEKAIEKEPLNPELYFQLGEYLYFECYWIRAAIEVIEKGLALNPSANDYRFMVIQMRYKFPMWNGVKEHYESIVKYAPKDKRAWREYLWFARSMSRNEKLVKEIKKRSPYHD